MRELVLATICDQPDIEIVGELENEADLEEAIERTRPDFLVIALESDARPALCDRLLERNARMKILALAPERNSSIFFWASVSIHSAEVESSERGILAAIREGSHAVEVTR